MRLLLRSHDRFTRRHRAHSLSRRFFALVGIACGSYHQVELAIGLSSTPIHQALQHTHLKLQEVCHAHYC